MTSKSMTASSDCEIVSSRIVHASRELVFKAWTDPEKNEENFDRLENELSRMSS